MTEQNVITIATSTGAEAEVTGLLLAESLGFRYVNDQVIEWAAARAGVSREAVAEVEHSQPLLARILQALAVAPRGDDIAWALDAVPYEDQSPLYRQFIRDVIEQVAVEGGAVIVAHGAGMLLAGRADVLRVFITASPAVRSQRIARERGCSQEEATRFVEKADGERAAYLRRFYGVRHELPVHYDLVVNTDALGPREAAGLIAGAARSLGLQEMAHSAIE
jgi:cytidylate kinase